ncbi:hypothetical protein H1W83_27925 (plasmid) [Priestia megaterium]|uniref:hypothetical protein n=1 Tax=Priestia megaterium TaxID=1404 RepID=UPI001EDC127E|nr:hypothetical protein [Priestia megaterium]UKJ83495.1 hypothetical protein H1W83_27925 [Priestia megaterium]
MQNTASLLLQNWSKIQSTLNKTLSSEDYRSLIVAKQQGINSLIYWFINHPDIARIIQIILGKYVAF